MMIVNVVRTAAELTVLWCRLCLIAASWTAQSLAIAVINALSGRRRNQVATDARSTRGRKRRASIYLAQTLLVVTVVITVSSSLFVWHRYLEKQSLRARKARAAGAKARP